MTNLGKFAPLWTVRSKIGMMRQVLLYVARYANIVQKASKMASRVLIWPTWSKYDHLWLCLHRNCQVWETLGKCHRFETEWHTLTQNVKLASSVISWPAMLSCGPVWLETSRLTNSITVCATWRTSVTVC
jgi:hypothetical protein